MNEYEVRVTRQALEQMKEIVHYISNNLTNLKAIQGLIMKTEGICIGSNQCCNRYGFFREDT